MKQYTEQENLACNAILKERISLIQRTMEDEGIENFFISWSGGKDSCVLSKLFDIAIPDNKIPRVWADTGLELRLIREFIYDQMKKDNRIVRLKPTVNIKEMLEEEGYPFSSKSHAAMVDRYNRTGLDSVSVRKYLNKQTEEDGKGWSSSFRCPKRLLHQFTPEYKNKLKISDRCCVKLKEQPLEDYKKENGYKYHIIGLRQDEGGRRKEAQCFSYKNDKLYAFQPLAPITEDWEEWFIQTYNVELCDIYKPPYNFDRTGCKGCPFSKKLRKELETLEKFFPDEHKQCYDIWKPVYDEYWLLRYRLLVEIK